MASIPTQELGQLVGELGSEPLKWIAARPRREMVGEQLAGSGAELVARQPRSGVEADQLGVRG